MHRSVLTVATLVAMLLVANPGGQSPDTGTLAGRVKLTTRVRGAAMPSAAYPARAVGLHELPPTPEIRHVVVSLKDVVFRGTLPIRKDALHQEHETFIPHVLPTTRGSTVDFPNDDPIFHNVFSLSGAATFNLGRYPRGQSRVVRVTRAGIVKVFCDIHSHMSATILVFDHPYFTQPGPDGAFELAGIPPGQYTIVGWHERVGERAATVRIERGKTTTVDLSLPVAESR